MRFSTTGTRRKMRWLLRNEPNIKVAVKLDTAHIADPLILATSIDGGVLALRYPDGNVSEYKMF